VPRPEDNLAEFQARIVELRRQWPELPGNGPYIAWTDGACIGNPGVGGWGTFIEPAWELFGHLARTTNNRAEALGVLAAIEWVPAGSGLLIHSDSQITLGVLRGTMRAKANIDLWQEIRRVLAEKALKLETEWVPGHAGISGNEIADYLSRLGATNGDAASAEALGRPAVPKTATPAELEGLVPRDDWERNFLRSIANQLHAGRRLSDKQQAIVDRIRARG
jgi:ribonuclease HI